MHVCKWVFQHSAVHFQKVKFIDNFKTFLSLVKVEFIAELKYLLKWPMVVYCSFFFDVH